MLSLFSCCYDRILDKQQLKAGWVLAHSLKGYNLLWWGHYGSSGLCDWSHYICRQKVASFLLFLQSETPGCGLVLPTQGVSSHLN